MFLVCLPLAPWTESKFRNGTFIVTYSQQAQLKEPKYISR